MRAMPPELPLLDRQEARSSSSSSRVASVPTVARRKRPLEPRMSASMAVARLKRPRPCEPPPPAAQVERILPADLLNSPCSMAERLKAQRAARRRKAVEEAEPVVGRTFLES